VVIPVALTAAYLHLRAADQYASTTGFAVQTEEMSSAFDILGGITSLGGSSSSDTDILYEYIQGQQIVVEVDRELDLRALWTRHWETDPVFSLRPDAPVEDLVDHWNRKVRLSYDAGTGLIEIQAMAFEPEEARAITEAVFRRSSEMINELSAIAREDATRYAREELDLAVERLKEAREAMSAFRSRNQMVDPSADLQSQMGLLNSLQSQLATALIELDLVRETAREGDPRISQAQRRIGVIESHIEAERNKFSLGGAETAREDYVRLLAEFDGIDVDLQFARQAYTAALAAFDEAQAEAQRKSRYLAAYVEPTLPQASEHPRKLMLIALTALFLLVAWSILALVYYSIRDRR
jgi:capsular polysaccharide transport system permease protein